MKLYTSETPSVCFTPTKAESIQGFLRMVRVPNGTLIRQQDLKGNKHQTIEILDNEKGRFNRK